MPKRPTDLDYNHVLEVGDAYWWHGRLINVTAVGATETRNWCRALGEFSGPTQIPASMLYDETNPDHKTKAKEH